MMQRHARISCENLPVPLRLEKSIIRTATNDNFDNRLVGRLLVRLIGYKLYFIDKKHYSTFCPMFFKQTWQLNAMKTYSA